MKKSLPPSRIIRSRWTEDEIQERMDFQCEHGHNGLAHPNCFNKENGISERKGCMDIESSNLKADFAICLSWCIKLSGADSYTWDSIRKEDIERGLYDAKVIASLIEEMWKYDRLITHYGNSYKFDIPFVRSRYLWLKARNLYKGPEFPGHGMLYVSDTYTMAKKLLAISSYRQNVVANIVQGKDVKTPIDRDYWMAITCGSNKQRKAALEYIVEHNIRDCEQLDYNYLALLPFVKESKTSI